MHTKLAALKLVRRTENGLNKRMNFVMKFIQARTQIGWMKFVLNIFHCPKENLDWSEKMRLLSVGREALDDAYDDGRDIFTRPYLSSVIFFCK